MEWHTVFFMWAFLVGWFWREIVGTVWFYLNWLRQRLAKGR